MNSVTTNSRWAVPASHHSARVTGTDVSVYKTFLLQGNASHQARMLFLLDHHDRMFIHSHRIRSINYGNLIAGVTKLLKRSLDLGLRSAENHMNIGVFLDCVNSAFNTNARGVIATHGIQCNFDHGFLLD